MNHRIFIAINLPEKVKKKLASFQAKYFSLPARWTKKENLHITLIFIGSVKTEEIPNISESVKRVVQKHSSCLIHLNKICYGPPNKMPPRMIWAVGKKSKEINELYKELNNTLFNFNLKNSKLDDRTYFSHITLAKIRKWEFKRIEPEERPQIEEAFSLSFKVNSIEIMESRLKKTGPEYTILESVPLQ